VSDVIDVFKNERVLATDVQLMAWRVTMRNEEGLPVQVRGPCPWCGHDTSADVPLDVLAVAQSGVSDQLPPPRERVTRVADCQCGMPHPRPAPQREATPASAGPDGGGDQPSAGQSAPPVDSCGRWWLMSVTLATDVVQPVRAGDESLLAAAKAVQGAVAGEETRVRTSAEKWIAGVAALLALFGLSGVVVGKDAFAGLPPPGAITAAVLTGIALIAAAASVVRSYKAAYLWPVPTDIGDDVELRAWFGQRRARVATAATDLVWAVKGACIALALLAGAIGVIWFWPREAPRPMVTVALADDSIVCGRLLDTSESATATIRVRRTNGEVEVLDVGEVATINVTVECRT
jgi:hypothetical protein